MTAENNRDTNDISYLNEEIPKKTLQLAEIDRKEFPNFIDGFGTCEEHKGWRLELVEISNDGQSALYYCPHDSHTDRPKHIVDKFPGGSYRG